MKNKPFRLPSLLFAVICLGLTTSLFAAKGGKKGPKAEEIPVVVTFADGGAHRIKSDGASYISAIGDGGGMSRFILDLRDIPREIFLDFSVCMAICEANLPLPFRPDDDKGFTLDAIMFLDIADGSDFIDIALDDPPVAGVLQLNFNDLAGVGYGLRFDNARDPLTTDVWIDRTGDESSVDGHAWQITADSAAAAILFKRGREGGKGPMSKRRVDIGVYLMSTQFTLQEY